MDRHSKSECNHVLRAAIVSYRRIPSQHSHTGSLGSRPWFPDPVLVRPLSVEEYLKLRDVGEGEGHEVGGPEGVIPHRNEGQVAHLPQYCRQKQGCVPKALRLPFLPKGRLV